MINVKGEYITHENLVDMFSTLDNDLRVRIMETIKKVIPIMEEEIKVFETPEPLIKSVANLQFVLNALESAHEEYAELFKRQPHE